MLDTDVSDASISIWMRWLPEISKANASDSDRLISSNIVADVCLVARSCEGIALHFRG